MIMSSHGSKGLQRTVVEECSEKLTIKDWLEELLKIVHGPCEVRWSGTRFSW